ncbi:hypothetical protein [Aureimonas pseudogalii]|uniref:CobQ/CobB/MinD/ParA nucleotide binding domain-containing protein n=1 Tax=Aureimonas pseudogalii TaxID=1744844 RepID=A0A7W6H5Q4_9HYPH|nr:hypothetical protein [Aureimonas pseudogalii]MBB3999046.1 hypothetical protein [Aureimonas pseudogalii]
MTFDAHTNDAPVDQIAIIATERGGTRKTATAAALTSFFLARTPDVSVCQIDDQLTLPSMFGDLVTTIRMPSADTLRQDDLADAVALEPLFMQILEGRGVTIVDCGANNDARFFDAAAALDLDHELAERRRAVTVIVPTTTHPDAILLACRTIKRAEAVLPTARIVPLLCEDGGSVEDLGVPSAQKAYTTILKTLDRRYSARHPRLPMRTLTAIGRTSLSPWQLPDMAIKDLMPEIKERMVLASYIRGDLTAWRAGMERTFAVLFG